MQQTAQKGDIAHQEPLVQPVGLAEGLEGLGRSGLAECGARRVDRRERHHEEDEECDAEDHQRQLQEAPADEVERIRHVWSFREGRGAVGMPRPG